MILLTASTKGGVTKTTTSANIAAFLSKFYRVACLDTDHQKSLTKWCERRARNYPDLPRVHCEHATGKIARKLVDLNNEYDIVLVDVKGGSDSSAELYTAAKLADFMLIPTTPSYIELEVFEELSELADEFKCTNDNLIVRVLMNRVKISFSKNPEHAAGYLKQVEDSYPFIKLLSNRIHEKQAFQDSFINGGSVFEMTGKYANDSANEVVAVINEIFECLGIPRVEEAA